MSRPTAVTDFGTIVPGVAPERIITNHARFSDVKTYSAGAMPVVKVGQVYEDLDPRCKGRRVQVLRVGGDGRVMVRTVTARTCPPRTPSLSKRDTTGSISWIALRRFRENSRGFRLIRNTPLRATQAYFLAARLADACEIAMSEMEVRAADALIGLLGNRVAHEYMDELIGNSGEVAREVYLGADGVTWLLRDAMKFAEEIEAVGDWSGTEIASRATARLAARHA
jgi:hypothetical protein